jgi:hypothetical protein
MVGLGAMMYRSGNIGVPLLTVKGAVERAVAVRATNETSKRSALTPE